MFNQAALKQLTVQCETRKRKRRVATSLVTSLGYEPRGFELIVPLDADGALNNVEAVLLWLDDAHTAVSFAPQACRQELLAQLRRWETDRWDLSP